MMQYAHGVSACSQRGMLKMMSSRYHVLPFSDAAVLHTACIGQITARHSHVVKHQTSLAGSCSCCSQELSQWCILHFFTQPACESKCLLCGLYTPRVCACMAGNSTSDRVSLTLPRSVWEKFGRVLAMLSPRHWKICDRLPISVTCQSTVETFMHASHKVQQWQSKQIP